MSGIDIETTAMWSAVGMAGYMLINVLLVMF